MKLYENFKKMIADNNESEQEVRDYCLEIQYHLEKVEDHCKEVRNCMDQILNELDDEDHIYQTEEDPELPVEEYLLIREKFGEEVANKAYYDVKFGKVPLKYVQWHFSKITN